jgi:hypothetical protein
MLIKRASPLRIGFQDPQRRPSKASILQHRRSRGNQCGTAATSLMRRMNEHPVYCSDLRRVIIFIVGRSELTQANHLAARDQHQHVPSAGALLANTHGPVHHRMFGEAFVDERVSYQASYASS